MKFKKIKNLCVFCGSSTGKDPAFRNETIKLGRILAAENINLVYGGSNVGLMNILAQSVLDAGGTVTGIIPRFFISKEIARTGLTELITVDSLQERKLRMEETADAFITLPGGYGSMDEMFEILTRAQLGLHTKPSGVLNVNGYYDGLSLLLESMTAAHLLKNENKEMLIIDHDIAGLLEKLENYVPSNVSKWINHGD
jgi:hypothetical protein